MFVSHVPKKKLLFYSIPLVIAALCLSSVVSANGVKIQLVSDLLAEKYPLDNYRSYLSAERGFFGIMNGDKLGEVINGLAEIFFTITRLIYLVFDYFVKEFYSMDVIGRLSDIVGTLTNNLWDMFSRNYATLIIVIALIWIGKTYFMDSPRQAFYQFGKIIFVLVVSMIWFPRANHYLTQMNNYSFGFQAEIMKVAGTVDATSALTQNGETSTNQATEIMRNELFKQTIYQPFLLVNYGTVNADEINKLYEKVDDKRIPKGANGDYLLSKEFENLKDNDKKDVLKKLAKENKYLTGDQVAYKLVISIFSVVCLFMYGVPLIGIAFANVFLQLTAIALAYLLPVIALISLLPRYSDGLVNSIVNVAKVLLGKGLLAFVVLIFTLINLTIDLLVPPSSITTVLANVILKGMIYYLLWIFREPLIRLLTRAVMNRRDSTIVNMRMKQFDHQMSDFASPAQFASDFGAASDGSGESFEHEDYSNSYEEPETPAYSNDEENQAAGINESSNEDESDSNDNKPDDQSLDVEEPEEVPIDDPELPPMDEMPVDDPELPPIDEMPVDDPDLPPIDELSVDDPELPPIDELPVDDPELTPIDEIPVSDPTIDHKGYSDKNSETSDYPSGSETPSSTNPTVNKGVEDQINRQIQHYNDNRTLEQENDFSQHQNVNVNHRNYSKRNTENEKFSSRFKELRD